MHVIIKKGQLNSFINIRRHASLPDLQRHHFQAILSWLNCPFKKGGWAAPSSCCWMRCSGREPPAGRGSRPACWRILPAKSRSDLLLVEDKTQFPMILKKIVFFFSFIYCHRSLSLRPKVGQIIIS
jgi:hypothetical protein